MRLWYEIKAIFYENLSISEMMDPSRAGARMRQIILLVRELWRSIRRDDVMNMAASLAFKTLLALVPVLAISLAVMATLDAGVAKQAREVAIDESSETPGEVIASEADPGQGPQQTYTDKFVSFIRLQMPKFPGIDGVVDSIRSFADNARTIYSVGFIFLFFTAFSLLNSIEFAFHKIWQIHTHRPFFSKLSAFLTTLIIVPVLMVLSVLLMSQIQTVAESVLVSESSQVVAWQAWVLQAVLAGSSLLVTCLAMSTMFYLLPNTPVRLRSALAGGAAAGLAFELAKYGFRYYAMRLVSNYTQVYGSLLAVPLFLMWVWLVWVVVLLGVELAFTVQNFRNLAVRAELEKRGISSRVYLAVRLVLRACRYFRLGESPREFVEKTAEELQVPPYILREIINVLLQKNVVRQVLPDQESYVPAKDIHLLTVNEVMLAIQSDPLDVPQTPDDSMRNYLTDLFGQVDTSRTALLGELSFADLVAQEDAMAPPPAPNVEPA